jgi:hypothetical protein
MVDDDLEFTLDISNVQMGKKSNGGSIYIDLNMPCLCN